MRVAHDEPLANLAEELVPREDCSADSTSRAARSSSRCRSGSRNRQII
ncbi:hypothetical protein [Leptospira sp. severe_002]|nr:hypothetical protein [Leptospira sp. severe_002]